MTDLTAALVSRPSGGPGLKGEGVIGVIGISNTPGQAGLFGQNTGEGFGVVGDGSGANTAGVLGRNKDGLGVKGEGVIGVMGISNKSGQAGLVGQNPSDGFGVVGDGAGLQNAGVLGRNAGGQGVRGEGKVGVFGRSSEAGHAAVAGQHTGIGFGVVGDGSGEDTAGIVGRHQTSDGVRGTGTPGVSGVCTVEGGEAPFPTGRFAGTRGKSTHGPGIFGEGHYGGQFRGTNAQLSLVPGATAGRPQNGFHQLGEIFMDSGGALFICVGTGSPGNWVKVATSPA
jgi:hypothetical protein